MESQNLKIQKFAAILLFGAMAVFATPALAQDIGVVAGIRADNADGEASTTINQKTSFQVGVIGKFELSGPLQIRSGMLYVQRAYEVSSSVSGPADFKSTYFEVPLGLLYKFSDYGGVFAGPALSFNLSKECPGGSCNGAEVNASPLAIQFGGSFKVAPQFGFEVYYEMLTGNIAKGVKNPRAVMANVMITFD